MRDHKKNRAIILAAGAIGSVAFVPSASKAGTITAWTFENDAIATNNNPAPSTGTGTASSLGMTNSFNGTTSTTTDDVLAGVSGDTGPNGIADTTQIWRVRGQTPGNGWSSQAAIATQGAEFAASTAGFNSINVSFDWYATNRGEGKMQLQYTTNGTTWNNVAITIPGADTGLTNQTNTTSVNTVNGAYVDITPVTTGGNDWFSNLTATISDPNAANDSNFAIRMVNASTGADNVDTEGTALNNTSGNWRFDNIAISGSAIVASHSASIAFGASGTGTELQGTEHPGGPNDVNPSGTSPGVSPGFLNAISNGAGGKGFVSIASIGGASALELIGLSITVQDTANGTAHVLTGSNDSATLQDIINDLNAAGAITNADGGTSTAYIFGGAAAAAAGYGSAESVLASGESTDGGNTFSILIATSDPQDMSLNFSNEIGNLDGITSLNLTDIGVVPEPTSMVGLVAIGAAALLGRRRQRNV